MNSTGAAPMSRTHHRLCNLNDPDTKPYLKGCNCAGMTNEHDSVAVLRVMRDFYAGSVLNHPEKVAALDVAIAALTREAAPQASGIDLDALVYRFLGWHLPDSVCADPCASMQGAPHRTGTNLLSAIEAKAMLQHVLGGIAAPAVSVSSVSLPAPYAIGEFGTPLVTMDQLINYGEAIRRLAATDSAQGEVPKPGSLVWQLSSRIGELTEQVTRLSAQTDSAIQSQQGATGGADAPGLGSRINARFAALLTCIKAEDAYTRAELIAFAESIEHPQAAGSAPGEAMPCLGCDSLKCRDCFTRAAAEAGYVRLGAPELLFEHNGDGTKIYGHPPSAGSVASPAVEPLSMSMFASRADYEAAAGAGSAPVGVEGLLDALARLCDEWEAEAKQRNGQAGRLALRRCAMAVREHIRTTAVSAGDAIARVESRFVPNNHDGTWDDGFREAIHLLRDAALEKERAE